METCLRIGSIELTGAQIVSALARYRLLDAFLGNILLEATLEAIPLKPEEIFYALTGGNSEQPDNLQTFLANWLEQRGLQEDYLEWRIYRELRLEKLKRARFDKLVESEFLRRKSEFDQVEFSLIQTRNEMLAYELFFQIRDEEAEFGDLSEKFSEGNERKTRGIVGPIKLSLLPEKVAHLLKQKQPKTIFNPIKLEDRFWIVRLENFCEARLTDEVCAEIRDDLFSKWLKRNVQELMKDPQKIQMIGKEAKIPPKLAS